MTSDAFEEWAKARKAAAERRDRAAFNARNALIAAHEDDHEIARWADDGGLCHD